MKRPHQATNREDGLRFLHAGLLGALIMLVSSILARLLPL